MDQDSRDQAKIFFVCPIGAQDSPQFKRSNQLQRHVIEQAFPDHKCHRADQMADPGSITHHIISAIQEAALVVIDMTDHNPNVFYEMALAHGFRRPVVHLIKKGEKIPFDVSTLRAVFYDLTDPDQVVKAREDLQELGAAAMESPSDRHNPLAQAAAFESVSEARDPKDVVLHSLVDNVELLTREMRRISRHIDMQSPLSSRGRYRRGESPARAYEALRRAADDPLVDIDIRKAAKRLLNVVGDLDNESVSGDALDEMEAIIRAANYSKNLARQSPGADQAASPDD